MKNMIREHDGARLALFHHAGRTHRRPAGFIIECARTSGPYCEMVGIWIDKQRSGWPDYRGTGKCGNEIKEIGV